MNETVNDYVHRVRLEKAISLVLYQREMSMTEIALTTGFSSSANFSKAFKLYFGVTPSQIRQPDNLKNSKIGKIKSKYGKDFDPCALYNGAVSFSSEKVETQGLKNIEIRDIEEKKVCCYSSSSGYEIAGMMNAWDTLSMWAVANGIATNVQQRFALCHDNPLITPIDKCRYDAMMVMAPDVEVKAPFWKSVIPSGKYVVATYIGDPQGTSKAYMQMYTGWLPVSGFEPEDYPSMEHYLNDIRQDGYVEIELHIKLRMLN